MPALDKPSRRRAYLLRFWEERSRYLSLPAVWRFSLEDPHTGRRHGFASLETLVNFLRKELTSGTDESHDEPED